MWQAYMRVTLLAPLVFTPAMLSIVLLWYFEALSRKGPLVVILLIPGVAWYLRQLLKIRYTEWERGQAGANSDPPPKYEKVMADPPPYDALFSEKPPAEDQIPDGKPTMISSKPRLGYRFCDSVATMSQGAAQYPQPEHSSHRISSSESIDGIENDQNILENDRSVLENDCVSVVVEVDERKDPELPSYQDAIRTLGAHQ